MSEERIDEQKEELFSIEKNDVDIRDLFEYTKEVDLKSTSGEVVKTVYMRIPGDKDINRARVWGIRASADLRQNLRDRDWEERELYVPDISAVEDKDLADLLALYNARLLTTEITNDIEIPVPKEPDADADLEEQEKYQRQIDEYPKLVREKASKELERRMESVRKLISKMSREDMEKEYERELINEACNNEFYSTFKLACTYFATFSDEEHTIRMFDNFEDFSEAPSLLRRQLLDAYMQLELSSQALKK